MMWMIFIHSCIIEVEEREKLRIGREMCHCMEAWREREICKVMRGAGGSK